MQRLGRPFEIAKHLLPYAWLVALAAALTFSAVSTDRRVRQVEEYPCCCDPFGYLQMAKDIRQGGSSGSGPSFTIESDHTRQLIQLMQSHQVPVPLWEHVVAPLAYHYFPRVDRVGVQYPPGAGLALALFPQDQALHGLARTAVAIFLVSGLLLLIFAALRKKWLSAGLAILSLIFGLDILAKIDNASFSINAMLAPLLLCALCLMAAFDVAARFRRSPLLTWGLTFLAGLLFGFAVMVRLPILLMMPGILVLLWNGDWRSWHKSAMPAFMLGALLGGALPLSIYQYRMTGAWYTTTYPSYDNTPPSLEYLAANFRYYFGPGKASRFFWGLPMVLIGCLGLFFWEWAGKGERRRAGFSSNSPPEQTRDKAIQSGDALRSPHGLPNGFLPKLTWTRLMLAASLVWWVTVVYNLTHSIAGHYYPVAATFGTVLLLGLGSFALDRRSPAAFVGGKFWTTLQYLGLALAFVPGLAAISYARSDYTPPADTRVPPRFSLPVDLADERAWIWADHLSGTIWYYTARPTHKLTPTNRETRELIYQFMKSRDEPHYLVADAPNAQPILEEIVKLGGQTTLRGEVEGYPYYLIEWLPSANRNR